MAGATRSPPAPGFPPRSMTACPRTRASNSMCGTATRRCASPAAAYVLPRIGQNGIPVISVNSPKAKLALYRIGDRNLISSVVNSDFRQQISGYGAQNIADRQGKEVWAGEMDTPAPLNKEVTTAFPVDEALGKLEAGLYVMTAQPAATAGRGMEPGRHAVVRGLRPRPRHLQRQATALRVSIRSIATAEPVKGAEVRLIARNNEVLATASHGRQRRGRLRRRAPQWRRRRRAGPRRGAERRGRLQLRRPHPARLRPDRPRRRGAAPVPGAVDAFVYTERGVYRRGETVHAAVLLRDASANAMTGTPLTLVVDRPDGVEYLAHHAERHGRRCRNARHRHQSRSPRAAPGASGR